MADEPTAEVYERDARELAEAKRLEEGRVKGQADGAPAADPTLHAHWARDNPDRIRELKSQGYRMATLTDVDDLATRGHKDGNVIRFKDTVLMVCPREAVEKRELERQREQVLQDRRATQADDAEGHLETDKDEHYQQRRGRKYSIP